MVKRTTATQSQTGTTTGIGTGTGTRPANRRVESGGTGTGTGTRGGTGKEDRDRNVVSKTGSEETPEEKSEGQAVDLVQSETLAVTVQQPKKPRSDQGKSHHAKKPVDKSENLLTAKILCASVSTVAVTITNDPRVAMTEAETQMIVNPLADILQGLSDDSRERLNKYANPVMVLAGLVLWGVRISPYVSLPKTPPKKSGTVQPVPTPEMKLEEPVRVIGQEGFPPAGLQAAMTGGTE